MVSSNCPGPASLDDVDARIRDLAGRDLRPDETLLESAIAISWHQVGRQARVIRDLAAAPAVLGNETRRGSSRGEDLGSQLRDPAMRLSDENLQGRTGIAADGLAIGEVSALFLDSDEWRSVGDSVILSVSVDALRQLLPGAGEAGPAH